VEARGGGACSGGEEGGQHVLDGVKRRSCV
jgi:hypothetical protein